MNWVIVPREKFLACFQAVSWTFVRMLEVWPPTVTLVELQFGSLSHQLEDIQIKVFHSPNVDYYQIQLRALIIQWLQKWSMSFSQVQIKVWDKTFFFFLKDQKVLKQCIVFLLLDFLNRTAVYITHLYTRLLLKNII